jgi:putative SOS response-associated peptidase YedK
MARIHDRVPVMLQDDEVDSWLDPVLADPEQLTRLLKAPHEDFLECYPVEKESIKLGSHRRT